MAGREASYTAHKVLKTQVQMNLKMSLLIAWRMTRWSLKILSNPNHSLILWNRLIFPQAHSETQRRCLTPARPADAAAVMASAVPHSTFPRMQDSTCCIAGAEPWLAWSLGGTHWVPRGTMPVWIEEGELLKDSCKMCSKVCFLFLLILLKKCVSLWS